MLSIQCLLMFVTAVIPAAIVWMAKDGKYAAMFSTQAARYR